MTVMGHSCGGATAAAAVAAHGGELALVAFEVALSQTNIIMLSSLCRNSHICLKGLSLLFLPLGLSL
jgi:hypothetical protein